MFVYWTLDIKTKNTAVNAVHNFTSNRLYPCAKGLLGVLQDGQLGRRGEGREWLFLGRGMCGIFRTQGAFIGKIHLLDIVGIIGINMLSE